MTDPYPALRNLSDFIEFDVEPEPVFISEGPESKRVAAPLLGYYVYASGSGLQPATVTVRPVEGAIRVAWYVRYPSGTARLWRRIRALFARALRSGRRRR